MSAHPGALGRGHELTTSVSMGWLSGKCTCGKHLGARPHGDGVLGLWYRHLDDVEPDFAWGSAVARVGLTEPGKQTGDQPHDEDHQDHHNESTFDRHGEDAPRAEEIEP